MILNLCVYLVRFFELVPSPLSLRVGFFLWSPVWPVYIRTTVNHVCPNELR
jgi:hypothetical protein